MNCLLTGGVGRLGSELIRKLASLGHMVRAIDLLKANWAAIEDVEGVEAAYRDVNDSNLISEACQDVDIIFHLDAFLPPKSESDRRITM